MDALHGRDDAQFAEARNIGGVEMLRMLDAPAQVLLVGMLVEDALVDIEHFAVGAVADGVDAELMSCRDGDLRGLANIGGILRVHAAAVRASAGIGVRRQQPGAARAERAIHIALDGANGEVIVREADDAVLANFRGKLRCRARGASPTAAARARPPSSIFFMRSMVANGEPASSNVVMPFERHSRAAISSSRRASCVRSSGRLLRLPVA